MLIGSQRAANSSRNAHERRVNGGAPKSGSQVGTIEGGRDETNSVARVQTRKRPKTRYWLSTAYGGSARRVRSLSASVVSCLTGHASTARPTMTTGTLAR